VEIRVGSVALYGGGRMLGGRGLGFFRGWWAGWGFQVHVGGFQASASPGGRFVLLGFLRVCARMGAEAVSPGGSLQAKPRQHLGVLRPRGEGGERARCVLRWGCRGELSGPWFVKALICRGPGLSGPRFKKAHLHGYDLEVSAKVSGVQAAAGWCLGGGGAGGWRAYACGRCPASSRAVLARGSRETRSAAPPPPFRPQSPPPNPSHPPT
jgi:hypothetical protein